MPINILGLDELAKNLQKYGEQGLEALEDGLQAAAEAMRDEIERQAPVESGSRVHYPPSSKIGYTPLNKVRRPGNLKKSIAINKLKPEELYNATARFKVGPGRGGFYGYFLEYGTNKMSKRPFVRPAFDSAQEEAIKKAGQVISRKLQGVK
jgi:HK97 gp10 family phage protein